MSRRPSLAVLALLVLGAPLAARASEPAAADAPPAFELAGAGALVLAADPAGDGPLRRGGVGLRASFDPVLLPRPWFVRAEAIWLHTSWKGGTRAVNVATAVDTVGLPLAAGYEWGSAARGWWLSPYLAAGPSLVRTAASYHVADPLADETIDQDWAELDVGAVYGAGLRLALPAGRSAALSLRAEALGTRRGAADDLALAVGIGVLF